MNDLNDLDKLSSKELHDRALRLAEGRLDVHFLWSLLETIPVAEVVSSNVVEGENDVLSLKNWLNDTMHAGDSKLADALRPFYIDYLQRHEEQAP